MMSAPCLGYPYLTMLGLAAYAPVLLMPGLLSTLASGFTLPVLRCSSSVCCSKHAGNVGGGSGVVSPAGFVQPTRWTVRLHQTNERFFLVSSWRTPARPIWCNLDPGGQEVASSSAAVIGDQPMSTKQVGDNSLVGKCNSTVRSLSIDLGTTD